MRKTILHTYTGRQGFLITYIDFQLNDYNRKLSNITNKIYDRKTKKYDYYKLPTILRSKGVKVTIKYFKSLHSIDPYKIEKFTI